MHGKLTHQQMEQLGSIARDMRREIERERIARVLESGGKPEVAAAIRDSSQDDLVFKWNGPGAPFDSPPKPIPDED